MRRVGAGLVVLVAVLLAGCGDDDGTQTGQTTGTSTPAASSTSPTQPTSPETAATELAAELAAIDPCELLTGAELAQLGFPAGVPGKAPVTEEPTCDWSPPGQGNAGVTLWPARGLDELEAGNEKAADLTVGGRPARKVITALPRTCAVNIEVADTAAVTVQAVHPADTESACARAEQVAGMVGPKLPSR